MTAPALPGAAPDPARLPPEVEATMAEAFRRAIEAGYDAAPDDKYFGAGNTEVAMDVLLASKPVAALRTAIRAALDKRGEVSAASSASARALGGDGEPVAYALITKGIVRILEYPDGHPAVVATKADADRVFGIPTDAWDTRVVPLYTRPAATGDTGEGGVALIGEAFGLIGHVVNHARRSTNIDGTRRRLGDDEACGRNWIALVDKCEALLAARAENGG